MLNQVSRSIRTFIGAEDFDESRAFYRLLGFTEVELSQEMSYFRVNDKLGFYLQDYYVKEWVENSMVFLEVDDLDSVEAWLMELKLNKNFGKARLSRIKEDVWGRELFIHDPAGNLWHIGEFKK